MFSGYRILLRVALAGLFPFADSAPPNPIQFTDVTGAAGIKFVHFNAETVEVQWPSGQHQVFRNVEADKFYLIDEARQDIGQQQLRAPAHHEKR